MAFREQFNPEFPVVMDMVATMNNMLDVCDGMDLEASNDPVQAIIDKQTEEAGLALTDLSLGKLDIPNLRVSQVLPLLYETYAGLEQRTPDVVRSDMLDCTVCVAGHAILITELFERWQTDPIYAPVMLLSTRQSFAISALGLQRNRTTKAESPDMFLGFQSQIVIAHGIAMGALADVAERRDQDILVRE